jgi:hypothetical protein
MHALMDKVQGNGASGDRVAGIGKAEAQVKAPSNRKHHARSALVDDGENNNDDEADDVVPLTRRKRVSFSIDAAGNGGGGDRAAAIPAPALVENSEPERKRGRTQEPLQQIVARLVSDFKSAGAFGAHFTEHFETVTRSVKRYVTIINDKLIVTDESETQTIRELTVNAKYLEMILSCIKLNHSWKSGGNKQVAIINFEKQWESLTAYVECPPKISVESKYMYDLFFEVYTNRPLVIVEHLRSCQLSLKYNALSMDDAAIKAFQLAHTRSAWTEYMKIYTFKCKYFLS